MPQLAPGQPFVVAVGRRLLVVALFLVGLGFSRDALRRLGWRPLGQGRVVWLSATFGAAMSVM